MNYKQSDITGETWTRCRTVTITNPLPDTGELDVMTGIRQGPRAYFSEEQVLSIESGNLTSSAGACFKDFDPVATIPLIDLTSGSPTGATVTHEQLYQILYSLYIQTATERDNK